MISTFLYTKVYYSWSDEPRTPFLESWGFYILMAVLLFVTAAWLLYTKAYKYTILKKSCSVPVDARLFAVNSKYGGKGGRFWNITYEFFYNEKRYIVNNDIWEKARWRRPIEGNVETIMINPLDPNQLYDRIVDQGRKTGFFCGILMGLLGIFILLMPLFVK